MGVGLLWVRIWLEHGTSSSSSCHHSPSPSSFAPIKSRMQTFWYRLTQVHLESDPRLRNDLYCVEWDVKLYYTIPYWKVTIKTERSISSFAKAQATLSKLAHTSEQIKLLPRCWQCYNASTLLFEWQQGHPACKKSGITNPKVLLWQTFEGTRLNLDWFTEQLIKLQCALCGDANLRRLERQSCSGWHHTTGQPLYQVSEIPFHIFIW